MRLGPHRSWLALAAASVAAACIRCAAGDPAAPAQPSLPTSLPSTAVLPAPHPTRCDQFSGRLQALDRAVECAYCDGKGERVRQVRQPSPHLSRPATLVDVHERCERCGGSGVNADTERLSSCLDALVLQLGAFAPGSKVPAKRLERCQELVRRLAATPAAAERLAARDRADIATGRPVPAGSVLTVTATLGRPIPVQGGARLIPASVGSGAAVLLRGVAINEAPEQGRVLVGGVVAGPVAGVEWEWGAVPVVDQAFIVPVAPAPASPAAGSQASAGSASPGR